MALKGFLASGFQKLIGAARIKGANNQWVGEFNKLTYTGTTVPISAVTPVEGFNFLDWSPTSTALVSNSLSLFSTPPSGDAMLVIRNNGTQYINISNNGSVAGGCIGPSILAIRPKETATYIYEASASRWRELSRAAQYSSIGTTPSGGVITAAAVRTQTLLLNPAGDLTVTQISPGQGVQAGDLVYLCNTTSFVVTLEQNIAGTASNVLIMNGDYAMTKNSAIGFVYTGTNWVELYRNMVGGYA